MRYFPTEYTIEGLAFGAAWTDFPGNRLRSTLDEDPTCTIGKPQKEWQTGASLGTRTTHLLEGASRTSDLFRLLCLYVGTSNQLDEGQLQGSISLLLGNSRWWQGRWKKRRRGRESCRTQWNINQT